MSFNIVPPILDPFAPEIPCHRCIASTGVSDPLLKQPCGAKCCVVRWRLQGGLGEGPEWPKPGVKVEAAGRRGRQVRCEWDADGQISVVR